MGPDRTEQIQVTFRRIARPLRWPLGEYRRRRVSTARFTGYEFTRARGTAVAGFAYGFALRRDALPGIREPPEAVVYVFVRPTDSPLYQDLVARPRSPVRRLTLDSRTLAHPFHFQREGEVVAVRHRSLRALPPELFSLAAADFFMATQRPLQTDGFVRRVTAATDRRAP